MTEGPVEGESARPGGYEHDDPEKYNTLEGTGEPEVNEGSDEDAATE